MIRGAVLVLLGWLALLAPAHAAAPTFPALTGRVVDVANVIPGDVEARLTRKLAALETQSHRQLVVVTLPDLQGYEISDYGYQLGRAWGIGSKEKNDGALLIVAPKERKLRIEVGYGLEGIMTDGLSSVIINQTIVPKLKAGDLPGGIEDGVDAIIHQLTLPEDEARFLAAEFPVPPKPPFPVGAAIAVVGFFVVIFGLIIFSILRSPRPGSRSYGAGGTPVTVWDTGSSSSSDWSSSSSDSFSGGGGDFGGGGASGDW